MRRNSQFVSVKSCRATCGIAVGQRRQRTALDDQYLGIGDGFGRKGVLVGELKPENVAGQIESADLAAAVAEDFVGAYGATDDLVEVFGGLVFAENLRIARIRHDGAHQMDGLGKRFALTGAVESVAGWRRGVARNRYEGAELVGANGGLCVHGPLPPGASGGIGNPRAGGEKFR